MVLLLDTQMVPSMVLLLDTHMLSMFRKMVPSQMPLLLPIGETPLNSIKSLLMCWCVFPIENASDASVSQRNSARLRLISGATLAHCLLDHSECLLATKIGWSPPLLYGKIIYKWIYIYIYIYLYWLILIIYVYICVYYPSTLINWYMYMQRNCAMFDSYP